MARGSPAAAKGVVGAAHGVVAVVGEVGHPDGLHRPQAHSPWGQKAHHKSYRALTFAFLGGGSSVLPLGSIRQRSPAAAAGGGGLGTARATTGGTAGWRVYRTDPWYPHHAAARRALRRGGGRRDEGKQRTPPGPRAPTPTHTCLQPLPSRSSAFVCTTSHPRVSLPMVVSFHTDGSAKGGYAWAHLSWSRSRRRNRGHSARGAAGRGAAGRGRRCSRSSRRGRGGPTPTGRTSRPNRRAAQLTAPRPRSPPPPSQGGREREGGHSVGRRWGRQETRAGDGSSACRRGSGAAASRGIDPPPRT